MSNFSEALKFLRKKHELTQTELAKELKVSRSTIGMYENGERKPDYDTLGMIAEFFNVDMNFLLGSPYSYDEGESSFHYLNDDVAQLAQEIYENNEMRTLFSAARDISKEDMKLVIDMVKRFKGGD